MIRIFVLFFIYVGTIFAVLLRGQDHVAKQVDTKSIKAEFIASELQRCPDWATVTPGDVARCKEITGIYLKLSAYDTESLRAGILRYLIKSENTYQDNEIIFAFLRVIFKIPQNFKPIYQYPTVMGNPIHNDGSIDLLWPFSINDAGHLVLIGAGGGIKGAQSGIPEDELEDFDYMASKFGRRPIGELK